MEDQLTVSTIDVLDPGIIDAAEFESRWRRYKRKRGCMLRRHERREQCSQTLPRNATDGVVL